MPYGTIKRWNAERGFGFISDDQNPRKDWSFVHVSSLNGVAPQEGDAFEYELTAGRENRPQAVDLKSLSPAQEECARVFG